MEKVIAAVRKEWKVRDKAEAALRHLVSKRDEWQEKVKTLQAQLQEYEAAVVAAVSAGKDEGRSATDIAHAERDLADAEGWVKRFADAIGPAEEAVKAAQNALAAAVRLAMEAARRERAAGLETLLDAALEYANEWERDLVSLRDELRSGPVSPDVSNLCPPSLTVISAPAGAGGMFQAVRRNLQRRQAEAELRERAAAGSA